MYPSLRAAPKGSTDHFDLSTPTTSRVSDGMPSAARISLMYSAALASFPGGLVVLIVSSCLSHLTASSETFASTLGDGCAAAGACARSGTAAANITANKNRTPHTGRPLRRLMERYPQKV